MTTTLPLLISLVFAAIFVVGYFYLRNKSKPLIPELGDEKSGIKAVTVNITKEELQNMRDTDKLKSYVVRYLVAHPIPNEYRIDQGLILNYVAEATRLLRYSYALQFGEPLLCFYNPDMFYREILTEVERREAFHMRDAHTIPLV